MLAANDTVQLTVIGSFLNDFCGNAVLLCIIRNVHRLRKHSFELNVSNLRFNPCRMTVTLLQEVNEEVAVALKGFDCVVLPIFAVRGQNVVVGHFYLLFLTKKERSAENTPD